MNNPVRVVSVPKSTNYRKKDMVQKRSQMKTTNEKSSEIPSETDHDWANAPTPPPIERKRQKTRENEIKTKEFSKNEIEKNYENEIIPETQRLT